MGLWRRLRDAFRGDQYQNVVEFSPELEAALRGRVNGELPWQVAVQVSTVLRCAVIKAEGICSVPWKLYRKEGNRRVEARDHPLWDLIHSSPNDWQTSFEFRKTIGLHLALSGNAYVYLNKVGRGRIKEMIPLEPSRVHVCQKENWDIEYRVTMPDGKYQVYTQNEIWHLKNHSWDSYKGLSALAYAKNAIDLAKETEKAQTDTHKHVARPSGVLSIESEMTPAQFKLTRKLVDQQVDTRLNRGYPMVVDKTMNWVQLAQKAVDSQTIESRGFQVEEIARAMGVLPIMLGYTGDKGSTYASAEQMFIHHFVHTTRVDHRNVEQSADKWLLTEKERRDGYYFGFVDQELLRGDAKSRGEFYRLLWMIGVITGNEIRRNEEMDDIEGLDRPWAPLANAPIGEDGMPMIVETVATDNNFKSGAEYFASAFEKASPVAQAKFIAYMRSLMKPEKPEEGEDL